MKLLQAILLVLMIIGNIILAIMEDSIYGQLAGLWAIQFAMLNKD